MANALNWFEIPASDFARAKKFYNTIFEFELLTDMDPGEGFEMGMFPAQDGVGGAVIQGEGYTPSAEGSLVYLNAGEDLSDVLGRVEAAGGQVIMPKTSIGENGFVAYFKDSEGNRVGLHSMG
ncbi:MAG: VOC family protein [Chloroflexota bacterium]|nr:MAG: VOC family protein [Chloroflexota bacterium]